MIASRTLSRAHALVCLCLMQGVPALVHAQQFGTPPPVVERVTPPQLLALDDIKFLSDDRLAGRMTGSPGADTAAAYLARRFEQAGLQPAAGGWFQIFTITRDAPAAQRAHVVGAKGQQRHRPASGPGPGAAQRGGDRRRALRSSRARRVRKPRPRQHGQGAQRCRRQRVGIGNADPDRRATRRVSSGPHGDLHRLQWRGARSTRARHIMRKSRSILSPRPRR